MNHLLKKLIAFRENLILTNGLKNFHLHITIKSKLNKSHIICKPYKES